MRKTKHLFSPKFYTIHGVLRPIDLPDNTLAFDSACRGEFHYTATGRNELDAFNQLTEFAMKQGKWAFIESLEAKDFY